MKKRVFEGCVILHTKNGEEWNTEFLISPSCKIAKSVEEVRFQLIREIPTDKVGDPDNIEIIVRPF